ncbi:MAG: MarR family transcriptional regulator [Candidatus Margulisbacteria bacterium]|nr:MarR family transcriptional regulator [Candidatus Margulisiibacteriota bacterium]
MNKNERAEVGRFDDVMQVLTKTFHSGCSYLAGLDITIQQFIVMNLIERRAEPKMTDLADELKVTLGNMTAMADRLIKLKYIIRKADAADRRVVRVQLTHKGGELIKKAKERKRKDLELILAKISHEDRDHLFKIMEKLVVAIKKDEEASLDSARDKGGKLG